MSLQIIRNVNAIAVPFDIIDDHGSACLCSLKVALEIIHIAIHRVRDPVSLLLGWPLQSSQHDHCVAKGKLAEVGHLASVPRSQAEHRDKPLDRSLDIFVIENRTDSGKIPLGRSRAAGPVGPVSKPPEH